MSGEILLCGQVEPTEGPLRALSILREAAWAASTFR